MKSKLKLSFFVFAASATAIVSVSAIAKEDSVMVPEEVAVSTAEKTELDLFLEADALLAPNPKQALLILNTLNTPEKIKRIAELASKYEDYKEILSDERNVELIILGNILATSVNLADLKLSHATLVKLESIIAVRDGEMDLDGAFWERIGSAYLDLGFADKGMTLLLRARAENCSSITLPLNLARGYNSIGNYLMGAEYAKEAIARLKDMGDGAGDFLAKAKIQLAMALIMKDKYVEAEKIIEAGIKEAVSRRWNVVLSSWIQLKLVVLSEDDTSLADKRKKLTELEEMLQKEEDFPVSQLANFLSMKCFFLDEMKEKANLRLDEIIHTCEKYFNYVEMLREGTSLGEFFDRRDLQMEAIFLKTLKEAGDVQKLTRWTLIFESKSRVQKFGEANPEKQKYAELARKRAAAMRVLEDSKSTEKMKNDANKTLAEVERGFNEIRKNNRQDEVLIRYMADSFVINPDYMHQFARTLSDKEALVQFVVLTDKIAVSVLKADGTPSEYELSIDRKFRNTLKDFQQALSAGEQHKAKRKAERLYKDLICPISGALKDIDFLYINLSRELRGLPFAALFDGEKYLIENYEIAYVSGHDMFRLAKEQKPKKLEEVCVSVFANPQGANLKESEAEGRAIQRIFGERVDLFSNENATKMRLEDSLQKGVNILHLATHGIIDGENVSNSGLLLSGGERWAYSEMLRFKLGKEVDLITLSACNTGKEKKDFTGFTLRLIEEAPADSIVASFWNVDDFATRELMEVFYREIDSSLKKSGRYGRSKALRQAQLELLKKKETASPCYWGAFALWGDAR